MKKKLVLAKEAPGPSTAMPSSGPQSDHAKSSEMGDYADLLQAYWALQASHSWLENQENMMAEFLEMFGKVINDLQDCLYGTSGDSVPASSTRMQFPFQQLPYQTSDHQLEVVAKQPASPTIRVLTKLEAFGPNSSSISPLVLSITESNTHILKVPSISTLAKGLVPQQIAPLSHRMLPPPTQTTATVQWGIGLSVYLGGN